MAISVGSPATFVASNGAAVSKSRKATWAIISGVSKDLDDHTDNGKIKCKKGRV